MNGIEKMCPEAWCMVLNFVSSVCPAGGRLDLNIHEWYDDGVPNARGYCLAVLQNVRMRLMSGMDVKM